MNEDQATPEVVQRKKGSTPDWLKPFCPCFAEFHPLSAYLDCDRVFRFWRPSGLYYLLTLTHLTAVTGDELMPGEQTQQAVFGDYVRLRMPLVRAAVSTSHGIYNIQCP